MAIHVYHGDDRFQSRRELTGGLKNYQRVEHLEGGDISPENLAKHSGGLFSQGNTALVLENFFSLNKKSLNKVAEYMEKLSDQLDFFVWQGKRLYPSQINQLPGKKKIREFKVPNTIFKFLDSIGMESSKTLLNFLNASFETHPPEIIFFLIQKRLRNMILAKENSEFLTGADWQKKKLYRQVNNLTTEVIADWYTQTVMIEWKLKTGRLGRELDQELVNLVVKFSQ
jgi:hypothetical protein